MRPKKVRIEDIRRDGKLIAQVVHVAPGMLVQYEGIGIFVNCNLTDPEHGGQPYVSIDTSELPPEHTYDENDPSKPGGMPKLAVHLNDGAELYEDTGAGDTAKTPVTRRWLDTVYMVHGFNDAVEPPALFAHEQDAQDFAATYDDATIDAVAVCYAKLAATMIAERKGEDG